MGRVERVPQLPYPTDVSTLERQGEYIKQLYHILQEHFTAQPRDFDIKLDDWLGTDDNTDLNASTTAHGLLPKLDNTATNFLNGTGAWSAPAGAVTTAFKTITGITNDVVADSTTDTLTLGSADNKLTIVGTTATDTITFTVDETNIDHDNLTNTHNLTTDIDHDALTNFAAGEHFTMLDEDAMGTNSDTRAATQQSIKAYVDGSIIVHNYDTLVEGSHTGDANMQTLVDIDPGSGAFWGLFSSSDGSDTELTVTIDGTAMAMTNFLGWEISGYDNFTICAEYTTALKIEIKTTSGAATVFWKILHN